MPSSVGDGFLHDWKVAEAKMVELSEMVDVATGMELVGEPSSVRCRWTETHCGCTAATDRCEKSGKRKRQTEDTFIGVVVVRGMQVLELDQQQKEVKAQELLDSEDCILCLKSEFKYVYSNALLSSSSALVCDRSCKRFQERIMRITFGVPVVEMRCVPSVKHDRGGDAKECAHGER